MTDLVIDLFSGIDGWGEGLRALGLSAIGIELDRDATLTARAAGHAVMRADVTTLDTARYRGMRGLVGSPPCQTFSRAGSREGIGILPQLVAHATAVAQRGWFAFEDVIDHDPRTGLVLEPLRFVADCRPEWVALEQVPDVLPVWKAYARTLTTWGYSTWAGVLCAADYGVPQTRHRAILMASRTRTVQPPPATHARDPQPSLWGPALAPWVSMAAALGWGLTAHPAATMVATSDDGGPRPLDGGSGAREHIERERAAGRWVGFPRRDDRGDGDYRERDWRAEDEPSFVVTEKARSWTVMTGNNTQGGDAPGGLPRSADEPARTLDTRVDQWVVETGRDTETAEGPLPYERDVEEPAPTVDTRGDAWVLREAQDHGAERAMDEPAMTITSSADNGNFAFVNTGRDWHDDGSGRAGAQTRSTAEPSPTLDSTGGGAGRWWLERPATAVCGDARNFAPEHHANAQSGEGSRNDGAIRLEPGDALVLQGFPRDYPLRGNRTSQFRCVGNAFCPPWAEVVVRQLT